jgi:hypothetical protein
MLSNTDPPGRITVVDDGLGGRLRANWADVVSAADMAPPRSPVEARQCDHDVMTQKPGRRRP